MDGGTVDDSMVGMIAAYCGLWFLVFTLGTLVLAAMNIQPPAPYENQAMETAATAVLATLNNIGPGLAAVGPWENFAFLPDPAKLLLSFFMILGRLEFYAVVVLFVRASGAVRAGDSGSPGLLRRPQRSGTPPVTQTPPSGRRRDRCAAAPARGHAGYATRRHSSRGPTTV